MRGNRPFDQRCGICYFEVEFVGNLNPDVCVFTTPNQSDIILSYIYVTIAKW